MELDEVRLEKYVPVFNQQKFHEPITPYFPNRKLTIQQILNNEFKNSRSNQKQSHMFQSSFILQILIPCFILIMSPSSNAFLTDNNHHELVYSQCSNKTSHIPLLSNLFQQFNTQSSRSSFFETIVADEKTAISGTFQCRSDLTPDECRSCVSKSSALSTNLCGGVLPARIQLRGCYARYEEEDGAASAGPNQVLHRACSKGRIKKPGFEEMKYAAFAAVESGVMVSENGFCEMTYESVHVVAQCAGRLGSCDCGECVSDAVGIHGDDECRYSVSGEVYMDRCFISYEYEGGSFGAYRGAGNSSPKLVAIFVGGLALLFLGIGFFQFMAKSCGKKNGDW